MLGRWLEAVPLDSLAWTFEREFLFGVSNRNQIPIMFKSEVCNGGDGYL